MPWNKTINIYIYEDSLVIVNNRKQGWVSGILSILHSIKISHYHTFSSFCLILILWLKPFQQNYVIFFFFGGGWNFIKVIKFSNHYILERIYIGTKKPFTFLSCSWVCNSSCFRFYCNSVSLDSLTISSPIFKTLKHLNNSV